MCKRILGLKDNELYTAAEVGRRLNDYFIKNKLKVKNRHYEKHLFLDLCKAEGIEAGKNKGSVLLPIAIKEIERVKANQPGKKKAPAMTPIEEMAKKTAAEYKKAEAAQAIVMDKADAMKTFVKEPEPEKCQDVPEVKTDPGDFEAVRKKFYTDFHYFIKFANTPEERKAILEALGGLYGSIGGNNNG